jgi:GAF domain-containing protein
VLIPSINQTYQFISWFIALFELILGLYILALNPWHPSNRHVSILLLLTSGITFLLGVSAGANSITELRIPVLLLGALIPAVEPWILIVTLVLLKPGWLQGRWKPLQLALYSLAILPGLLTLIDAILNTNLWFSGLPAGADPKMNMPVALYTGGVLGAPLRLINLVIIPILTLLLLIYILFDKKAYSSARRMSVILLIGQAAAILAPFSLRGSLFGANTLITSTIYALVYTLAVFAQMISERRYQRGSLRTRLTALILMITMPIIFAVVSYLGAQASTIIVNNAGDQLLSISQAARTDISLWITANSRALEQLAESQDIASMQGSRQKTALEKFAGLYPFISQVSTVDLQGLNVSRSDANPAQDYSQSQWFKNIAKGEPVTYETGISSDSGKPVLVIAKPIHSPQGQLTGVVMMEADLSEVNKVTPMQIGKTGYVFAVDNANHAVISPEIESATKIIGMEEYPPVKSATRDNVRGFYSFSDENGKSWRSYISKLDNGWVVVVQQPESELYEPLHFYQRISWVTLISAAALLAIIIWLSIRKTLQPINVLTSTATAVAGGELNRSVPVESTDEIGRLSTAFNSMTAQLRELVASLEKRVKERTRDLERRAVQMQTAALVASEAAAIQDMKSLLDQTVGLISESFNFYHTGIFLIDEAGEYAILQAANSEGGIRMLARGHKLQVGKVGIVGNVASTAKPRIALNVGSDSVFFNNPDLPLTKSEMAVPMKARGRVIGVLDVQSTREGAFTEEDTEVLQILADQIALAIMNTRLLEESQKALAEIQRQYRRYTGEAWRDLQKLGKNGYVYNRLEVKPIQNEQILGLFVNGSTQPDPMEIRIPLTIRNQIIGSVSLKRDEGQEPWTGEERALANEAAIRISQALENARLLEEIQRRSQQERIITEITSKVRASTNVDIILQTAIQELAEKLHLRRGAIQMRDGNEEVLNG